MSDRVLVISQVPPPHHGSTVMTEVLLRTLKRIGHDPELVDRRFSRKVADVGKLSLGKVLAAPSLWWRTWRAAGKDPRCAVVFLTNRPASFISDAVVVALLRARGIPVVHYIHTVGFDSLADRRGPWRTAVRGTLRSAAAVVVLGPSLRADVEWAADADRVVEITNIPAEPPSNVPPHDGVYFLFLSNLIPEKGALEFAELALAWRAKEPNTKFLVAGGPLDGPHGIELAQYIHDHGLEETVKLLGSTHGEEKWALLSGARALIFPSRYPLEAQPLTILESVSTGTPVLAYRIGGIADLAHTHESVDVFDPGDQVSILAAMARVSSSPKPTELGTAKYGTLANRYANAWASAIARVAHSDEAPH